MSVSNCSLFSVLAGIHIPVRSCGSLRFSTSNGLSCNFSLGFCRMENTSSSIGFFVACRNGDLRTARELLKHVNSSNLSTIWEGRTCFHVAVISGDSDLLREVAAKLPVQDLKNIIKTADKKGDTPLHLAVRKTRFDLVKQLVCLDENLCDCVNKERETPLKLAVSLGFKEAVVFLITRTSNALHYVVELNQVKLVQYLKEKNVKLSELINKPYQPTSNPLAKEDCGKNSSLDAGNSDTNPLPDQHTEYRGPIRESSDGRKKSSRSNGHSTIRPQNHPIVLYGDTPLHIAARNKYEHMVNLLLKVDGVDKQARNSEDKTPFDVAREVTEYYESFRVIRKLAERCRVSSEVVWMDCAPQVTHEKRIEARRMVNETYRARRDSELVVAGLLATMTCAAAFTVPGGFDQGSPNLISLTSFKLFLIFDCIAFFLSLFVCIMWEMSSELTTGDKMIFMTVNTLVVCFSFGFTAYGFMCAVYVMLERKVKTFSWVVLGCLIAIIFWAVVAFIYQTIQFSVKRARFHRLCGISCFFDDVVERVWTRAACCGLLNCLRSGDDVSQDLITGHAICCGLLNLLPSNDDINTGSTPQHEVSHNKSPLNMYSRSSSPLLNRI